jgi:hypothetical protein
MGTKLTELMGPDGLTIYLQYESEETEELRAVGVFDNIVERMEKFKETRACCLLYNFST